MDETTHTFPQQCFLGLAFVPLPATKGARIHAQAICQFLLGYARKATIIDNFLPDTFVSLIKERHIAEKFNDSGYIM